MQIFLGHSILCDKGLNKTKYALMIFTQWFLLVWLHMNLLFPNLLTRRKILENQKYRLLFKDQPMIIEIKKLDDSNFVMVSED